MERKSNNKKLHLLEYKFSYLVLGEWILVSHDDTHLSFEFAEKSTDSFVSTEP